MFINDRDDDDNGLFRAYTFCVANIPRKKTFLSIIEKILWRLGYIIRIVNQCRKNLIMKLYQQPTQTKKNKETSSPHSNRKKSIHR